MRIEFPENEWNCGHDGHAPEPIRVATIKQAEAILHAISRAISQPGQCRAVVVDHTGLKRRYFLADDHMSIEEEPSHG
jgi:hypothetical protein